jgi:rod shape determining protein RodA
LQPTELAKVAGVIMVATYLARREEATVDARAVVKSLALLTPAMALALSQPDMGTPVVLLGAWLAMLFLAGANPSHLVAVLASIVWAFIGAWTAGLIKPHQKARLLAFANPEADPQGAGWQVKQALIAIGSGRLFGQGYLHGTQTQLNFIPDQEADFIFSAVAEEFGLVGGVAVLGLLALVLYRGLAIAGAARDRFGRVLAAGFVGVLATHVVVNVGMTLGLAPVKGMPLPLLSYGGSHMLACMAMVGLLNNIHLRRRRIDFDL